MRTRLSLFWAAVRWTLCMFLLTPLLGAPDMKPAPVTPAKPIRTWDGLSSWYGPGFHGRQTANGEIYDMYAPTAAHPTLPLGSVVRVVNKRTGRSRVVRINDRGPYIEGREIDVSYGVARSLGFHGRGVARVRIELLTVPKPAPRVRAHAETPQPVTEPQPADRSA